MKVSFYLLVDQGGSIEIRKRQPTPMPGTVAIRLALTINDAYFKQTIPSVEITIPDAHVLPAPFVQTLMPEYPIDEEQVLSIAQRLIEQEEKGQ